MKKLIFICLFFLIQAGIKAQYVYEIYSVDFRDTNAAWLCNNNPGSVDLKDGFLNMETFSKNAPDKPFCTGMPIVIDAKYDFKIEVRLKKISGVMDWGYGLFFAFGQADTVYFDINSQGSFCVDESIAGKHTLRKAWTKNAKVNQGISAVNMLTIIAEKDKFKYYVNNTLVLEETHVITPITFCGFTIDDSQKIQADYFKITTDTKTGYYLALARQYLSKGDYQKSLDTFGRLIELDPSNSEFYLLRAQLATNRAIGLSEMTKYDESVLKDLNKALELNSHYSDAYFERAKYFYLSGNADAALADIESTIKYDSTKEMYLYAKAQVEKVLRKYDAAIEDYNKLIKKNPNAFEMLCERGFIYDLKGNKALAEADYARAIETITSDQPDYYDKIIKGKLYLGDYEGALKYCNQNISADTSFYAYSLRGTVYASNRNLKEALADFNKAIASYDKEASTIFKRGLVKKALGDLKGAQIDFDAANKLDPNKYYLDMFDEMYLVFNVESSHGSKQTDESYSSTMPPILSISDITFSEKILEAGKNAQLSISLKNTGPGDANNVFINLSGQTTGLTFPSVVNFPNIKANGGVVTQVVNLTSSLELPTTEAIVKMEVVEPNFKIKIQGKQLRFSTREFKKPELILAKYAAVEAASSNPNNQIDLNEMIDVKIAVQNVGQGDAEGVSIDVKNNQKGVMFLGVVKGNELKRENSIFPSINSGKFETVTCRYFINSEFTDEQLNFTINTTEKNGKYGFNTSAKFPINKQLAEEGFIRTVASTQEPAQGNVIIENIPDFVVDVDTNIPENKITDNSSYALIIGNEDYSSKQRGLSSEQNVDFAANDAQMFALYCQKTLGIPPKQVKLLKNATAAEISQGLAWISNLSDIEKGNAKLIFFYSGHGLPNEQTKEPYIIPVDVSASNIEYAIKLADVYAKLTAHSAQQITVFLDACFSGGGRNKSLLDGMRPIQITSKTDLLKNNIVVFTSSSGSETSAGYSAKKHGYFTYFLLKKLQESKGNTTLGELGDYVTQNVRKEVGLSGKVQTPQVNVSPDIESVWKTLKIIK